MLCIHLKPDFAITRRLLNWLQIERDVSQEYEKFSLGEMVILTCSQGRTGSGCGLGQESSSQKEGSRMIRKVRTVCYIIADICLVQGSAW